MIFTWVWWKGEKNCLFYFQTSDFPVDWSQWLFFFFSLSHCLAPLIWTGSWCCGFCKCVLCILPAPQPVDGALHHQPDFFSIQQRKKKSLSVSLLLIKHNGLTYFPHVKLFITYLSSSSSVDEGDVALRLLLCQLRCGWIHLLLLHLPQWGESWVFMMTKHIIVPRESL